MTTVAQIRRALRRGRLDAARAAQDRLHASLRAGDETTIAERSGELWLAVERLSSAERREFEGPWPTPRRSQ
ncbi:MAG: hypothetical protein JWM85_2118 [Acidimicrobiaceae bacterium]|nr:hypothetical protein [Acidimicrobiaceae bacterium]